MVSLACKFIQINFRLSSNFGLSDSFSLLLSPKFILSPNEKMTSLFGLTKVGLSLNFGLSERLIQKVKSPIALATVHCVTVCDWLMA